MAAKSILFDSRVRVPADVLDLAGFRRWVTSPDFPERGRVSFLDGELEIDMSPEEFFSHGDPKGEITSVLWSLVRDQNLGRVFPDRSMLVNDVANVANEPDLMFCSWHTLETGEAGVVESKPGSNRYVELHGSPDLVVEIVSDSSVRKDTKLLRDRYYRAGIFEYWLIDARGARLDFKLLVRGKGEYVLQSADRQGFRSSTVLPGDFKLTRERDRIGHWRYTLLHRDVPSRN